MPYQLHCAVTEGIELEAIAELLEDFTELAAAELTDELDALEVRLLELAFDDAILELIFEALVDATEDATELDAAAPSQTAPLITGISALAPPLFPCTPNSTDCPG